MVSTCTMWFLLEKMWFSLVLCDFQLYNVKKHTADTSRNKEKPNTRLAILLSCVLKVGKIWWQHFWVIRTICKIHLVRITSGSGHYKWVELKFEEIDIELEIVIWREENDFTYFYILFIFTFFLLPILHSWYYEDFGYCVDLGPICDIY